MSLRSRGCASPRENREGCLFGCGEEEGEDGAVAVGGFAAADADPAFVVPDDFEADPEAEAGSGGGLGGEEGFEEAALGGFAHAAAIVGDGDAEAVAAGLPVMGAAGAEADVAVAAEGVEGVADEVGEDLAHVAGKADEGVVRGEFAVDV